MKRTILFRGWAISAIDSSPCRAAPSSHCPLTDPLVRCSCSMRTLACRPVCFRQYPYDGSRLCASRRESCDHLFVKRLTVVEGIIASLGHDKARAQVVRLRPRSVAESFRLVNSRQSTAYSGSISFNTRRPEQYRPRCTADDRHRCCWLCLYPCVSRDWPQRSPARLRCRRP